MAGYLKNTNNMRKFYLLTCDLFIVITTNLMVLTTAFLLMGERLNFLWSDALLVKDGLLLMGVYGVVLIAFKLYDSLWRFAESEEFIKSLLASLLAGVIFCSLAWYFIPEIPMIFNGFTVLLITIFLVLFRLSYRAYRSYTMRHATDFAQLSIRILLVGGGAAANMLLKELASNAKNQYNPVCIVDDDENKQGRSVNHVRVVGKTSDVPQVCQTYEIDEIFICIPSMSKEEKQRILEICAQTNCKVSLVPEVYALTQSNMSLVKQIREVSIEDLLGRDPISLIVPEVDAMIYNKVILVTGGGGSIGSELSRQIAMKKPKLLILLDIYENSVYALEQELRFIHKGGLNLVVEIASIRDQEKMAYLFAKYHPQIIFHAAAHKHVPLMEHNPEEAYKNNILGTKLLGELAISYGAERFVLISTDKAVNPTNFMGATKRFTEMLIQLMNGCGKTKFVAVRFGNVIGSNGSVIPLFEKQIAAGGPLTVTHKDIIRYFMTIPEAVQLVLQAGTMTEAGGEIFILDMGEPVRIYDMAEKMIRLSGLEPHKDIEIQIVGLRPGEKLYEELLMSEEGLKKTENKKIFIGNLQPVDEMEILQSLEALAAAAKANDRHALIKGICLAVKTYHPQNFSAQELGGEEKLSE